MTLERLTWRTLEPLHGMIYFSPEADAAYKQLGLTGRMGYFASRAAALGPVTAEAVIATFYNFDPQVIRQAIPAAWHIASPPRSSTPGSTQSIRHCAACSATQLTRRRWPVPPRWPGGSPSDLRRAERAASVCRAHRTAMA
ncbi:hypothetical protein ACFQ0B_39505 [Nonomuraea thailandensis]